MTGANIIASQVSSGKTQFHFPNGTQGYTLHKNQYNISLNPWFGWFIKKNVVAGVQITTGFSKQKIWLEAENGNNYKQDNQRDIDAGAGIFLRYYITSKATLKPFAHIYFNGGSGSTETDGFYYATNYSQTYEGNTSGRFFYNAGINAGLTRMINSSLGLEAFIGYIHSYNKFTTITVATINDNGNNTIAEYQPTQRTRSNGMNFGIGLQIFID